MIRVNELKLPIESTMEDVKIAAARVMKISPSDITELSLFRRSIDSRKGELKFVYSVDVTVNGKNVGVLWYPPYRTDITDFVKAGDNTLEIAVTNNWANRLIGDEQYEADFEWGRDRGEAMGRAMKAFPDWFLKGEERPSKGRKGFVIWSYFRQNTPLEPAGLTGPVKLEIQDVKYD